MVLPCRTRPRVAWISVCFSLFFSLVQAQLTLPTFTLNVSTSVPNTHIGANLRLSPSYLASLHVISSAGAIYDLSVVPLKLVDPFKSEPLDSFRLTVWLHPNATARTSYSSGTVPPGALLVCAFEVDPFGSLAADMAPIDVPISGAILPGASAFLSTRVAPTDELLAVDFVTSNVTVASPGSVCDDGNVAVADVPLGLCVAQVPCALNDGWASAIRRATGTVSLRGSGSPANVSATAATTSSSCDAMSAAMLAVNVAVVLVVVAVLCAAVCTDVGECLFGKVLDGFIFTLFDVAVVLVAIPWDRRVAPLLPSDGCFDAVWHSAVTRGFALVVSADHWDRCLYLSTSSQVSIAQIVGSVVIAGVGAVASVIVSALLLRRRQVSGGSSRATPSTATKSKAQVAPLKNGSLESSESSSVLVDGVHPVLADALLPPVNAVQLRRRMLRGIVVACTLALPSAASSAVVASRPDASLVARVVIAVATALIAASQVGSALAWVRAARPTGLLDYERLGGNHHQRALLDGIRLRAVALVRWCAIVLPVAAFGQTTDIDSTSGAVVAIIGVMLLLPLSTSTVVEKVYSFAIAVSAAVCLTTFLPHRWALEVASAVLACALGICALITLALAVRVLIRCRGQCWRRKHLLSATAVFAATVPLPVVDWPERPPPIAEDDPNHMPVAVREVSMLHRELLVLLVTSDIRSLTERAASFLQLHCRISIAMLTRTCVMHSDRRGSPPSAALSVYLLAAEHKSQRGLLYIRMLGELTAEYITAIGDLAASCCASIDWQESKHYGAILGSAVSTAGSIRNADCSPAGALERFKNVQFDGIVSTEILCSMRAMSFVPALQACPLDNTIPLAQLFAGLLSDAAVLGADMIEIHRLGVPRRGTPLPPTLRIVVPGDDTLGPLIKPTNGESAVVMIDVHGGQLSPVTVLQQSGTVGIVRPNNRDAVLSARLAGRAAFAPAEGFVLRLPGDVAVYLSSWPDHASPNVRYLKQLLGHCAAALELKISVRGHMSVDRIFAGCAGASILFERLTFCDLLQYISSRQPDPTIPLQPEDDMHNRATQIELPQPPPADPTPPTSPPEDAVSREAMRKLVDNAMGELKQVYEKALSSTAAASTTLDRPVPLQDGLHISVEDAAQISATDLYCHYCAGFGADVLDAVCLALRDGELMGADGVYTLPSLTLCRTDVLKSATSVAPLLEVVRVRAATIVTFSLIGEGITNSSESRTALLCLLKLMSVAATRLRTLVLTSTPIDDAAAHLIEHLAAHKSLENVNLRGTNCSEDAKARIRTAIASSSGASVLPITPQAQPIVHNFEEDSDA